FTTAGVGAPHGGPAPYDLRVRREGDGVFHLSWKLPPGVYDRIHVPRGTVPIADGIGGTNTTFGDVAAAEQPSYRVFGIKNECHPARPRFDKTADRSVGKLLTTASFPTAQAVIGLVS